MMDKKKNHRFGSVLFCLWSQGGARKQQGTTLSPHAWAQSQHGARQREDIVVNWKKSESKP